MAYEVTATRRRPQTLKQLVGQEFVVSTIENSINKGQIAHAYLFSGPRGTGKTSSARILAKSLNCQEGPTAEPCGVCNNCLEVTKGNSLDVIEIDGASNTGVNDIREIKDEVLFAPTNSRYKVYIIDEVHMLSNSAFNALLKTIEEPPPYIIFIFATTEIHKVPATIRSRCQQFNFRLFSLDTVKEQLIQACNEMNIDYDDDALLWIAKEGTGSMRDSYTLFDQVLSFSEGHISIEKIQKKLGLVGLDRINELVKLISIGEIGPVVECGDRILAAGISVEQFLVELAEYFRNILLIKSGVERESLLGSSRESFDREVVAAFTANQLLQGADLVFKLYKDIRFSLNQRFELELLLSRMARLRSYFSSEELLGQIQQLREQLTGSPITLSDGTALPAGSVKTEAPREGEKKKSLNNIEPDSPSEENGDAAHAFFNMFGKKRPGSVQATSLESQPSDASQVSEATGAEPAVPDNNTVTASASPSPADYGDDVPPDVLDQRGAEMENGDSSSGEGSEEVTRPVLSEGGEWWETLLDQMRKDQHAVLGGSMSKGKHGLEGDKLTLSFPSRYIAEQVSRDKAYITKMISRLMDREIKLNILVEEPVKKEDTAPRDEKVDLFVRVFRGTVIQQNKGEVR